MGHMSMFGRKSDNVDIAAERREIAGSKTLRVTPAMEAGLNDHVWSMEELVALLPEPKPAKRGPTRSARCKKANSLLLH